MRIYCCSPHYYWIILSRYNVIFTITEYLYEFFAIILVGLGTLPYAIGHRCAAGIVPCALYSGVARCIPNRHIAAKVVASEIVLLRVGEFTIGDVEMCVAFRIMYGKVVLIGGAFREHGGTYKRAVVSDNRLVDIV